MRKRSSSRLSVAVWAPLCALIALSFPSAAVALKAPPPQLSELEEADRKALETIASYPESTRESVLKASLHVDALVETQRIQEQSSASFQDRIGKLDKKQQEQIWEIVREPGLIDELATEERPRRSELDEIAKRYPESLAPAIRSVGAKHHDLLVDIAEVHHRANERFDVAISDLDPGSQQAFRDLVDKPELLSVLVRRVNLVVRLGDSYRKNPKDTRSYLAALSNDVAKRNAAAEREWKDRIESDPEAAAELDRAARDYSEEYGYDYEELTRAEARTRVTITVNPYPFWFGYPYWYSDVYLYPYGYWYPYRPYFGYYYHHSQFVWWGFPSFAFVHWFYWGHHHHHFAHLHHHFHGHFANHRHLPGHRFTAANNFIARRGPVDGHRADWSTGRGGRDAGARTSASVGTASSAGRDRGGFNRNRSEDGSRGGMRTAPGQAGRALTNPGGDRGFDRTTGLRRNGGDARGRGNVGQSPGRQEQRFFQRPGASPQREAASSGSARGQGSSHRSRERGVDVIRGASPDQPAAAPSDRGARGRSGRAPSVDSGPRDRGGSGGPSWNGGGERRSSRGHGAVGAGDGGSRSRSFNPGDGGGSSRSRSWSGGGGGGSRGGPSWSGGGGGGGGRGGFGGGGRGGGGFGGGGRGGGGGGRGR